MKSIYSASMNKIYFYLMA